MVLVCIEETTWEQTYSLATIWTLYDVRYSITAFALKSFSVVLILNPLHPRTSLIVITIHLMSLELDYLRSQLSLIAEITNGRERNIIFTVNEVELAN